MNHLHVHVFESEYPWITNYIKLYYLPKFNWILNFKSTFPFSINRKNEIQSKHKNIVHWNWRSITKWKKKKWIGQPFGQSLSQYLHQCTVLFGYLFVVRFFCYESHNKRIRIRELKHVNEWQNYNLNKKCWT